VNVGLFRILSKLAAFLGHSLKVVWFEAVCREIEEVVFLFEGVGGISHRWEVVDLFDKLERLAFVTLMHNEYINIINYLHILIVYILKLLKVSYQDITEKS
jgi:hypothetical protein